MTSFEPRDIFKFTTTIADTYRAIAHQPVLLFGMGLLFVGLPAALNWGVRSLIFLWLSVTGQSTPASEAMIFYTGSGPAWIATLIYLLSGAALQLAVGHHLADPDASFGRIMKRAAKQVPAMTGLFVATAILIWIGSMMLIIPGIIAAILLFVAPPAIIFENSKVPIAMKRSVKLTENNRIKIFLLTLLFAVAFLPLYLSSVLIDDAPADMSSALLAMMIQTPIWTFHGVVLSVLSCVTYVNLVNGAKFAPE